MTRLPASRYLLEQILARVPEGLIEQSLIAQQLSLRAADVPRVLGESVAFLDGWFYDRARLSPEGVEELAAWCCPGVPPMTRSGEFLTLPLDALRAVREERLQQALGEPCGRLLAAVERSPGYLPVEELGTGPEADEALATLLRLELLRTVAGYVFDPLCLSTRTVRHASEHHGAARDALQAVREAPLQTLRLDTLVARFGKERAHDLLRTGWVVRFAVTPEADDTQPLTTWVRRYDSDAQAAREWAQAQSTSEAAAGAQQAEVQWREVAGQSGDVLRPGAVEGRSARARAAARTYLLGPAAQQLGVGPRTLRRAIADGALDAVSGPDERMRIPAAAVQDALASPDALEGIHAYELVKPRDIALVARVSYATVRRRLAGAGLSQKAPLWKEVRGQWGLPERWSAFRELARAGREEWLARVRDGSIETEAERRSATQERLERQQQERSALRARLVAAFPAWRHAGRAEQQVVLHLGPPNSGKTHEALDVLAQAGSGWYLAPLRLLAFEVFDRLNARGVACNLLTGEESIPVPGARITAATVEMFAPDRSGECVVIDEAQMLADPERGWAWTRALMEAESPAIHVIGPPSAEELILDLAESAALPVQPVRHARLAPIRVAQVPWPLEMLRPRTILVAFSRRNVLALKTALEARRRSVSVIYGDLPPEVRRRQSDRFAAGEAEICVATDAVGMGLNLPADAVCFYEIEKFDGRQMRKLTPAELHQIGGRAGRFGLSQAGEIGGVSERVLGVVRRLYEMTPEPLRVARVAPSVEDLEMIPGSLAQRLAQWAALKSIPERLRGKISTVDLQERVELAQMLAGWEVDTLGLAPALKLVNAPAQLATRPFWRACVSAILRRQALPLPPDPPDRIRSQRDLGATEMCIHCADVYLWLGQRPEFRAFAPAEEPVRRERTRWSRRIDDALVRQVDTSPRCSHCGRRLPVGYRYGLCETCFRGGRAAAYER